MHPDGCSCKICNPWTVYDDESDRNGNPDWCHDSTFPPKMENNMKEKTYLGDNTKSPFRDPERAKKLAGIPTKVEVNEALVPDGINTSSANRFLRSAGLSSSRPKHQ